MVKPLKDKLIFKGFPIGKFMKKLELHIISLQELPGISDGLFSIMKS